MVGQIIHRNGQLAIEGLDPSKNALPLSEGDVPGACCIYAKLEKHSVDQLRRWLACR